jgi:hypothetical protein
MTQDHDGKIASVLAFDVEYQSATGKHYRDAISIDMSEYKDSYQLGKPHLYAIAQSLDNIEKDIGHLTTGFRRLKTDVYTSADRESEEVRRPAGGRRLPELHVSPSALYDAQRRGAGGLQSQRVPANSRTLSMKRQVSCSVHMGLLNAF